MRAATIRDGEILIEQHPDPAPGKDEVLVRVRAAGLNGADMMQRRGLYPAPPGWPQEIPGLEIAGEVLANGAGASRFAEGDRVMAIVGGGGQAELAVVHERMLMPVPEPLDWPAAGGFPEVFATAHDALFTQAGLGAGERLLVHGGAGGVGTAAIQLGAAIGARVIATARGAQRTAICRRMGADLAIDYTTEDFVEVVLEATGGLGADVIYDPVGGELFERSRRCIAFEGRLLVVGFASGQIPSIRANHTLLRNFSVVGVYWGLYRKLMPDVIRQAHEALLDLYRRGAIDPLVDQVIPFERAVDGVAALGDRRASGKIVVSVHDGF
jgi:NADPH:quinone reductase